jgi:ketosteroid isomerase-like protein
MRAEWRVFALGLMAVAGCGPGRNLDAERAALLDADRRFAEDTAARGADGWAATFLPDGVMFPPHGRVDGREAIRERMAAAFAPGRPKLRWEPGTAVLGASADLGYTLGRWKSVPPSSAGGDSILAEGNYVTIWKKDGDGAWQVAVDIGNSDPEP